MHSLVLSNRLVSYPCSSRRGNNDQKTARLYGLLIVTTLTMDPVLGPVLVPIASRNFYCHAIDIALYFLSLSFWSNNIIIACKCTRFLSQENMRRL